MSDTPKSFDEWWNTDPKDEAGKEYGLDEFYLLREGWRECITHRVSPLERENADLRAKLEAAQRDAERYRWLREPTLLASVVMDGGAYRETLDDEIDAAMQEGKP